MASCTPASHTGQCAADRTGRLRVRGPRAFRATSSARAGSAARSIFYYWSCPWEAMAAKVLAAMWVVLTILKDPIILVCLLMVSKGWCITRTTLSSNEIAVSSCIVTLLYAVRPPLPAGLQPPVALSLAHLTTPPPTSPPRRRR